MLKRFDADTRLIDLSPVHTGDCTRRFRQIRQQSPFWATVAEFGDKLSIVAEFGDYIYSGQCGQGFKLKSRPH